MSAKKNLKKCPVAFIGHGSPMNALAHNQYSQILNKLGEELGKPNAILCVSAHWLTQGTWVTSMDKPKTIHDFYGFPEELFQVQYPAPGSSQLATEVAKMISSTKVNLDNSEWGLDHGTWSVLKHLYPKADVPVIQLSIDMSYKSEAHFQIGRELSKLREKNILILGSGNIVHNLRTISFKSNANPFDWALEFDQWSKKQLENKNFESLINDFLKSDAGKLSIPTLDHYLPLLYVLGAVGKEDKLKFIYEGVENASISMRSFIFGE